MPLSSTPTRTLREPSVILWAWSALIICMSHCSASRGSAAAAGASTPGRSPLTGFFAALLVAGGALAPRRRDVGRGALGDRDAARRADRVERVAGRLRRPPCGSRRWSEWATMTPICGQAWTTTPPAFCDRVAHDIGLAGVGDLGVEQVAEDDPVGGHDRHGGRRVLGGGGRGGAGSGEQGGTERGDGGRGESWHATGFLGWVTEEAPRTTAGPRGPGEMGWWPHPARRRRDARVGAQRLSRALGWRG